MSGCVILYYITTCLVQQRACTGEEVPVVGGADVIEELLYQNSKKVISFGSTRGDDDNDTNHSRPV